MLRNREQEYPLVIQAVDAFPGHQHIFKQSVDVGNLAGSIGKQKFLFPLRQACAKHLIKLIGPGKGTAALRADIINLVHDNLQHIQRKLSALQLLAQLLCAGLSHQIREEDGIAVLGKLRLCHL